jgi:hypothetical protein
MNWKVCKRSGNDLIWDTIPEFAWSDWGTALHLIEIPVKEKKCRRSVCFLIDTVLSAHSNPAIIEYLYPLRCHPVTWSSINILTFRRNGQLSSWWWRRRFRKLRQTSVKVSPHHTVSHPRTVIFKVASVWPCNATGICLFIVETLT